MRRLIAASAATAVFSACGGGDGRELARYYDPGGYFITSLPAANELVVTPPQPALDGPGLLTGVVARPPQPSPAPQQGFGMRGMAFSQTEVPDQTVYQAFAITTDGFEDLGDMGLFLLTADPSTDVQVDDEIRIDGLEARLVVADVKQDGAVTASVAAAFTLGSEGTGFLVAAIFPPGQWDSERGDFFRMVDSFRTGMSPGLAAFPITA
ncbi:MAG TPA: hypothetical protein VLA90_07430 [Actinomycetota bacterium]|nr:hypothetical protein [Actinomycetota bacterium]